MDQPKKTKTGALRKNTEIKYQKKLKGSDAERQTRLQLFRPILIESVAAGFPNFLPVGVILAVSRIKTPQEIKIEGIYELLQQLVIEGMFIQTPDEPVVKSFRFCFNDEYKNLVKFELPRDKKLYDFSDKQLREILSTETENERRIRLIKRRANTFLQRQKQFDDDLKVLHSHFPSNFDFDHIGSYLTEDWTMDQRRNNPSYLSQCLITLVMHGYLSRSEITGTDYTKIEKDFGY
jgi:hypothetical protein